MVGGVVGAQFGVRAGQNMRGEWLRLLLGVLVLLVGMRFAIDLVLTPADPYLHPRGEERLMRRFATLLTLLLLAGGARPAAAERLVVSLSNHRVEITSNFTGADLVLFGTIEPDKGKTTRAAGYDLVVTVTGPRQNYRTRRKGRVMGIWVNADSREFVNVPSYLAVLSNRPVKDIAQPDRCCGGCRSASTISS